MIFDERREVINRVVRIMVPPAALEDILKRKAVSPTELEDIFKNILSVEAKPEITYNETASVDMSFLEIIVR